METIRICHLYGDLLNTYGDNGNLLILQWRAKEHGYAVETTLVSLDDPFDPTAYDIVFFGGGQDFEQSVVATDIPHKKEGLKAYIEDGGVLLAICGGYQLLGHYYIDAKGTRIDGAGVLDWYTLNQENTRFVGDIEIQDPVTGNRYHGYENHNGRTFLGAAIQPLGCVTQGHGNNGEDAGEGAHYKNVMCSYFHGPLLVRNVHLADRLIAKAIARKQSLQNTETETAPQSLA